MGRNREGRGVVEEEEGRDGGIGPYMESLPPYMGFSGAVGPYTYGGEGERGVVKGRLMAEEEYAGLLVDLGVVE